MLTTQLAEARSTVPLTVRSEAFEGGKPIPDVHSAYHDNVSPGLNWSGAPDGSRSFAILVEDPDAPYPQPFIHWLIANVPKSTTALPGRLPNDSRLAQLGDAVQGANGKEWIGYFGPRPPKGDSVHHYHFQVFALDTLLDLEPGFTREDLLKAMSGHVLAKGQIVGTYEAPPEDPD